MAANPPAAVASQSRTPRLLLALAAVPAAIALACWWVTDPLTPGSSAPAPAPAAVASVPPPVAAPAPPAIEWPEGRLEGEAAKALLLPILRSAKARLDAVDGYTARFRKQERLRGKLGAENTLAMKVRHQPFSIYLKYLAPKEGKEAVYCEGRHDNMVIAHNGDWTRRLVPRLKVAPDDPIALADNRHPVTDAGLLNLVNRLIGFREMDLIDPDAVTILDRTTDDEGRPWLRSVHTHPHRKSERPFARVEVLYDPETKIPMRITSFDWPEPGDDGPLRLAERYAYDDVAFDCDLSDHDFDPANPEYAFTRF